MPLSFSNKVDKSKLLQMPSMTTQTSTPAYLTSALQSKITPKPLSTPVATSNNKVATNSAPKTQATSAPMQTSASPVQTPIATAAPVSTQNQAVKSPLGFSSIVGDLASASKANKTQTGLLKDLQMAAQGNKKIGDDARNISSQYAKEIERVGNLGAGAQAGYLSTGSNVIGAGNAAIASQSVSQRMSALAAAQQAALEGTSQQLTGQSQTASALNQALGGANTQQSAGITGLSSAAGYAQPELNQYGQQYYDPITGQGMNEEAFAPVLQQYAQLYASGQQGAIPSSITSNPVLNAQVLNMAQKLNPNFNYNTAVGQAGAQQQTTQVGGTIEQTANAQIYQQALADVAELQNQIGNVDQLGSLLATTAKEGGINPSDIRFANQTIAQIRNQLSSAEQAQFDSSLATLQSKITGLLSIGGNEIPSDVVSKANSILNGSLPLSALNSVLGQIEQEGQIILKNQQAVAERAFQGTQVRQPSNNTQNYAPSSGGGNTNYNF